MNTNKPPDGPATGDITATSLKPTAIDPQSKLILTLFPRTANPKQIADALNELRRQHSPSR